MWRFLNGISRGFKNHVHSLRPSAGLYVEEEQEALELKEKACPFSGRRRKSLGADKVRGCKGNILNSLRPSAGLYMEEEQEALELKEKACPFSGRRWKSLGADKVRGCKANILNSLRPSAGLYVEEEQEALELKEKACPFSGRRRKSLGADKVRGCKANILNSLFVNKDHHHDTTCQAGYNQHFNTGQEDGHRQKSSCHYTFWRMFAGSHRMLEALSWGSMVLFGADAEKHRQKSRLLIRVLLTSHHTIATRSINGGLSIGTASVLHQDVRCAQAASSVATVPQQLGTAAQALGHLAAGAQGPADGGSHAQTLDSAMQEFECMCTEYTAKTESLLGLEAAVHGDFSAAAQHLQSSCALGNTSACFNLALCYETGSGVPQDLQKARHYYNLAAKQGHTMALYNLGLMCMQCSNHSSPQPAAAAAACTCGCDPLQGLDLLEKAAQLGLAQAQTYLGIHHVEQNHDVTRAVSYFRAAAEQHDVDAQYFLAVCYEQGWGVEVNECRAAQLYSQAAGGGHEVAIYNLAVFNEHGLGGLPQDTSSALDLFQKAADLGCEQAKRRLEDINIEQGQQQRLEDINIEQAKQRLGDIHTPESSNKDWNSKVEMFRQLYLHHNPDKHRPRHSSSLSPSASSPNLSEHFHRDIAFLFEGQSTDVIQSQTYSRSQPAQVHTRFHLGSDGEYEDDNGMLSPHSDRSSLDDSFESSAYHMFPSVRNLHKSQSYSGFSLIDSGVQV